MALPNKITWVSVYTLPIRSYTEVLVVTHHHSAEDWNIGFGYIQPVNDYKEYEIHTCKGAVIPKSSIISIGLFQTYGSLRELMIGEVPE